MSVGFYAAAQAYKPTLLTSRVGASPTEQRMDEFREQTIHDLQQENRALRIELDDLRRQLMLARHSAP